MKTFFACFLILAISGCGIFGRKLTPEEEAAYAKTRAAEMEAERVAQEKLRADAVNVPRCYTDEECKRMWTAARSWVSKSIVWKVQTMSEGYLETYSPSEHSPKSAARVVQEPIPNGGYQLTLTLWCRNIFGCDPSGDQAVSTFNRYVWDSLKTQKTAQASK